MKFSTALAPRSGPQPDGCGQRRHDYAAGAPDRRLQGATVRSAAGAIASNRTRKRRRAPARLPPRRRCRTDGNGSSAATWERSTPGRRGPARRAPARSRRASLAQCRAQTGVEVVAELGGRGRGCGGKSSDDEQGVGGQRGKARAHEMPQPSGDAVAHHRLPDGLAHHEPGARRDDPVSPVQMHDKTGAAAAATTPDDGRELVPVRQPGCDRQHRDPAIRRRAARGPCHGGRRWWRDRRACASAAGTRACATGGGCSAGRCACPCSLLGSPGRQPARGGPPVAISLG